MHFEPRQTLIIAILVLFFGRALTVKIPFLAKYNIPDPVSGGLLASLVFAGLQLVTGEPFTFSLNLRDALLLVFFTTVGLNADIGTLLKGGRPLVILLALAVGFLFIQNIVGVTGAKIAGMELPTGVLAGSVAFSGGHGTAIAWAPTFAAEYEIAGAMEIGVACATFGLILGGLLGGPLASWLIKRNRLETGGAGELTVGLRRDDPPDTPIGYEGMLVAVFVLTVTIGIGLQINHLLVEVDVQLPDFVPCLLTGIVLTNLVPRFGKMPHWPMGTRQLALLSELSLGLFLAMSLMSLDLVGLAELAGPVLVIVLMQVVAATGYAVLVVFRAMGRHYTAAVVAAGYVGLSLGATPTAIANMSAVTKQFGPAPQAFIIVPLVGAFFIDVSNAFIINLVLGIVGH